MTKASDYATRLQALLRQLRRHVRRRDTEPRPPLEQLIFAFLVWDASHNQAERAYSRLMRQVVDLNDLRVTDPTVIVQMIGDNYRRAEERAHRLSRSLHSIYRREHAMDLSRLNSMAKREARAYLDELEGMVPFVSASVVLESLGGHAIPVDEQLHERLRNDAVVDDQAPLEQTQAFLEYHIRSDEALGAYYLLRAYVERPIKVDLSKIARSAAHATKKPTRKKSTKKTTKKSTRKKK